jgi:uncharacterized C2H2 Zn-finger protein
MPPWKCPKCGSENVATLGYPSKRGGDVTKGEVIYRCYNPKCSITFEELTGKIIYDPWKQIKELETEEKKREFERKPLPPRPAPPSPPSAPPSTPPSSNPVPTMVKCPKCGRDVPSLTWMGMCQGCTIRARKIAEAPKPLEKKLEFGGNPLPSRPSPPPTPSTPPSPNPVPTMVKCPKCNAEFPNEKEMYAHFEQDHLEEEEEGKKGILGKLKDGLKKTGGGIKKAGGKVGKVSNECSISGCHNPGTYRVMIQGKDCIICDEHQESVINQLRSDPTGKNIKIKGGAEKGLSFLPTEGKLGALGRGAQKIAPKFSGSFFGFFFYEWIILGILLIVAPLFLGWLFPPIGLIPTLACRYLGPCLGLAIPVWLLALTFIIPFFKTSKGLATIFLLLYIGIFFWIGPASSFVNLWFTYVWTPETQCYMKFIEGPDAVNICLELLVQSQRAAGACIDCLSFEHLLTYGGSRVRVNKGQDLDFQIQLTNKANTQLKDVFINFYDSKGENTLNQYRSVDELGQSFSPLEPKEIKMISVKIPSDPIGGGCNPETKIFRFRYSYGYRMSTNAVKSFALFQTYKTYENLGLPSEVTTVPKVYEGPISITLQAQSYYVEPENGHVKANVRILMSVASDQGVINVDKMNLTYASDLKPDIQCKQKGVPIGMQEKQTDMGEAYYELSISPLSMKKGEINQDLNCEFDFPKMESGRNLVTLQTSGGYSFESTDVKSDSAPSESVIVPDCEKK